MDSTALFGDVTIETPQEQHSLATKASISLIEFYKRRISAHKGYSCAHRVLNQGESCSSYGLRVVKEVGIKKAIPMISARFGECGQSAMILNKLGAETGRTLIVEKGLKEAYAANFDINSVSSLMPLGSATSTSLGPTICGMNQDLFFVTTVFSTPILLCGFLINTSSGGTNSHRSISKEDSCSCAETYSCCCKGWNLDEPKSVEQKDIEFLNKLEKEERMEKERKLRGKNRQI